MQQFKLLCRFYPKTQMKIRSTTLSAFLVGSSVCLSNHAQAWVTPFSSSSRSVSRCSTSCSTLKSTVAPEGELTLSPKEVLRPTGDLIAKGTIISQFPGGLTAIRIEEELSSDDDDEQSPTTLDPSCPTANVAAAKSSGSSVSGDLLGKHAVLPNGAAGVVVAHRPPVAFVWSTHSDGTCSTATNGSARVYQSLATISVSDDHKVVDCFGRPLDGTPYSRETTLNRPIFAPIPQLKDIALINNPMLTGITMMDALSPIGQGQNMLMVGYDLDSMRGYAMDFLQTQIRGKAANDKKTRCVYATTHNHEDILQRLREAGIADDVHLVAPINTEKDEVSRASEAVAIAGAACAIGEAYALNEGANSLVVVDTIDMHKKLWDTTTRVLVDVFGADAVVEGDRRGAASSEMRAFYSSLIQRSAQYNKRKGGGSVTLLLMTTVPRISGEEDTVFKESEFENSPQKVKDRIQLLLQRKIPLTAANLRKLDIPVPSATEGGRRMALQHVDDLISMSDGQIWLDERLEGRQEPPLDPQRSLTRIGIGADTVSRADAPALRRVAEGLRLTLSQALSMDGAEETKATMKQTQRQKALMLAMYQKAGTGGRRLSESCVTLLSASEGYLDNAASEGAVAGSEQGAVLIEALLQRVWDEAPQSMHHIDETLDISKDVRTDLLGTIKSFFA